MWLSMFLVQVQVFTRMVMYNLQFIYNTDLSKSRMNMAIKKHKNSECSFKGTDHSMLDIPQKRSSSLRIPRVLLKILIYTLLYFTLLYFTLLYFTLLTFFNKIE